MKKIMKISALCLALTLCLFAVACSSYNKLEKAFLDKGYQVSQGVEDLASDIETELEQEELAIQIHALKKSSGLTSDVVLIIEFKSTQEMIEACKESDTLKGIVSDISDDASVKEAYDTLVAGGFANGNCIVFSINPLNRSEVCEIVKNA